MELTEAVNGESIRLTRSSRALDTHPLKAFIMTSICPFIVCISAIIGNGAVSMKDGRLMFCRFDLLWALLPSGLSWSLHSVLLPSWFSSWTLCLASLWRSCSSRSWFYWVRCSTAAIRVWTCLSNAVDHNGSPSWTLLVVVIEWVSTMQFLCPRSDSLAK